MNQNKVFKTLPLGSDPKLYNEFVRPYIASTWGGNNGTVYDERGKFFEGCIKISKAPELYAVGQPEVGMWKQHVGQTGAGTTVRPICDELSGGTSDVYNKEFPALLMWLVMTDKSIKEFEKAYDPLSFMLLLFRAISRPYSHNQQIQKSKQLMTELQPFINEKPELLVCQLKNQVMAMVHRLDHYYYVHRYIHKEPQATAQKRTVATGGTRTTDFLPALIKTNYQKALDLLEMLNTQIDRLETDQQADYREGSHLIEVQLNSIIKKIEGLMKKAKKVESADDQ